ncbi:aminotransferase class IV [Streptomyces sp. SL13]|uniref:Aminotransferase class IV n=1 Tax=Streptantibioticus silvisoli TaxID=2705255 RepID=A0AA90H242_9ACTN|nr:aminotransferase class IV [Streptantibioticus silvisoli]MDI5962619.1 aminotransferase class IV [Streptantibioticus silvisoli]MDI5969250.1 aminotransferase class IV [Streptantibioticus silvisoli]
MSERYEIDGRPVTAEAVLPLATGNFGHFTAMQVRGGAARGLDLHLGRLDSATRELFGGGLDGGRVREAIRHALAGGPADASVRVVVFRPAGAVDVSLLVAARAPAEAPREPQSLMSVAYQRPAAHLKHLGGFGQAYFGRLARAAGFDDALLTGPGGVVSEGAVANIGFLSGRTLVWPDAPALEGTGMGVLERRLADAGLRAERRTVRLADVGGFDAAVLVNSWGVWPVCRIDDTVLPSGAPGVAELIRLYAGAPWDVV